MRAEGAWRSGALAVTAACCLTVPVGTAGALEPGVHLDPGSPAAKEYALPLDQARQTGSESPSKPSSEGGLFGAGIKPPGSGSPRGGAGAGGASAPHGAGGETAGGSGGSGQGGTGPPSTGAAQAALTQTALRAAREPGSGGGNGSILALVGGGVAILVLGGFGGTVLRHSRRPRPSA
jgi:hypothetical protein